MLTIPELRALPDGLDRADIETHLIEGWQVWNADAPLGWHESLFRSSQLLQKVKELLELNTPASVILEIIAEVERQ